MRNKLMSTQNKHAFFYLGLIWCWGLLSTTLFMQYGMKLEPCPLCIVQRLVLFLLGIVFLIACFHRPQNTGKKIYCFFIALISIFGVVIAGRHTWLQNNPTLQIESCGASLSYMLKTIPLTDTIRLLLQGTSECNKVEWRLLGLSLAEWSLLNFVWLSGLSIYYFATQIKKGG